MSSALAEEVVAQVAAVVRSASVGRAEGAHSRFRLRIIETLSVRHSLNS